MMKNKKIANIVLSVTLILILVLGQIIFKSDYGYIFKVWFGLLIMGISFFPITSLIFKKSHNNGWIFSKVICLGISGLLMWMASYTEVIPYSQINSYIIFSLLTIGNVFIYIKKKDEIKVDNVKIRNILITEILFIAILFSWIYIKGLKPTIDHSTEKYMDYGFMNSIMNTKFMPPEDIWLAGNSINYYYFGQYICGFLCKFSGITAEAGYNIVLALVCSLSFIMPYSIGYDLAVSLVEEKKKIAKKIIPITLAIFMGISMALSGTLHFPIYKFLVKDRESYYYPNGTRYIGFNPETDDKVCTENPAYSSVVGDLHAHFIDLMFSFAIIAIMLEYFMRRDEYNWKKNVLNPNIIIAAILLGIQKMTNYWDFIIYIVVIGITIIAKHILHNGFNKETFKNILFNILEVAIIQELVALPFTMDFNMISSEIRFATKHTAFYQLLVLWGLPATCVISSIIAFIIRYLKERKEKFTEILEYGNAHLYHLFILILGLCGLGLILISEIVYIKDIYVGEYNRFNTVFKLSYEAFIFLNICTNYLIAKMLLSTKKTIICFGIFLGILNLSTVGYGIDAILTAYKDQEYKGIANIYNDVINTYPDDYKAIEWINKNIEKDKVILEASSAFSSYTDFARVSVFTGNPTVFGWYVHEWLWRNENYQMPIEVANVQEDVKRIYTNDNNQIEKLLKKYNVSYIFIGKKEVETYEDIDLDALMKTGDLVYPEDDKEETDTYIIRVK